jgi:hypothetical protein
MSVRVVARIRPLLKQELDKDTIVIAETLEGEKTPTVVRLPSPKNDAESNNSCLMPKVRSYRQTPPASI